MPIAGADMRRAITIWKLTEASMKGKTNRQKPLIVTPDLGVRVTKVQQTLSVDIMFVYLTPLALVQVYDLADDRGAGSVGPGITKFISAARGRGFEVKFIRTDGEGAIAALTIELEDEYGLVVEPTACGRSGADVRNAEEESPMPFPRPTGYC